MLTPVPACTLTSLLIRNAAEARQVLGGVGQVPRYSGWVSCLRSILSAVRAQRVGRDFGLFFCFLVVLVELLDHHASRDEDVDHDQAEVEETFGQELLGQVHLHGAYVLSERDSRVGGQQAAR